MTNRREFLRTGVSVSALPLANGLVSPNASARTDGISVVPSRAVFDDRYAECRAFGQAISGFGVPSFALKDGDVTDLWASEVEALGRRQPAAITGLTQFGPMLVFEQLGREHRMRLRLRIEHQIRDDGKIAHVMTGPPATLALAEHLRHQGAEWPALIATLMTRCDAESSTAVEQTMVLPGAKPELGQIPVSPGAPSPESVIHYYMPQAIGEGHGVPWDGPLYSWMIAPAARRTRGFESPFR